MERPSPRRRRQAETPIRAILPLFHCGDENRLVGHVANLSPDVLIDLARPMLIVGPPGSGKSSLAMHLAERISIASAWDDNESSQRTSSDLADRVLIQPAIDFARQFAASINSHDMPEFTRKIDSVPVWVVDDLHLIADKIPAQEELAARLDAREMSGGVTILTCRRLPTEIRGLRSHLVSRTLPGLTVPVCYPRGEARRTILRELMIGILSGSTPEQIAMLDAGLEPDLPVRSLEAAVRQTELVSRMNDQVVGADAIRSVLETVVGKPNVTIGSITTAVARQLGVTSADIRSGSRRQNIVRARALAMFPARQLTDESLTQIGDAFGGRDHSTVLHAIRKTQSSLDADTSLRRAADQVTEKLTA